MALWFACNCGLASGPNMMEFVSCPETESVDSSKREAPGGGGVWGKFPYNPVKMF